jgi:hypothetical protein
MRPEVPAGEHVVEVRAMTRLGAAGLAVFAILLLVSAQAGATGTPAARVKRTASPVWTLALAGPRVAYASAGRIYVWNLATGATSVVKGEYSNAAHTDNASEIAIAGTRLAWIKRQQIGNTEQPQRLYTATIGGSAHRLRRVLGYTDMGCGPTGSQISGLVGSGSLLAVSTWQGQTGGADATNRRLNLITPTRLRPIATGPGAVVSGAAAGKHIAVVPLPTRTPQPEGYCDLTPPTSVSIRSAGGKLLRRVATGPVGNVALSGKLLVAVTPVPSPSFEVYDWTTGALLHTWPVPSRRFDDFGVSGRLAVYSVFGTYNGGPATLHVLDLTTGKDAVVAASLNGFYRDLAVGRLGLVYVANRGTSPRSHGKLVFVPTARLLRLTSG